MEQWLAKELGRQCAAAASPDAYENQAGWWTATDFAVLMPEVELAVRRRIESLRQAAQE